MQVWCLLELRPFPPFGALECACVRAQAHSAPKKLQLSTLRVASSLVRIALTRGCGQGWDAGCLRADRGWRVLVRLVRGHDWGAAELGYWLFQGWEGGKAGCWLFRAGSQCRL